MVSIKPQRFLISAMFVTLFCWTFTAPVLLAQVAPPRAPATAASPPEELTIFSEGTYPQPDVKRTTIYYSRPSVKNPTSGEVRKIWGDLVPWDKPWRLGANQATLLISQSTLQFGDIIIPANMPVTLYMLPVENGPSKLIINKQIGQSGVDYDEKQDLGRVDLKKDDLTQTVDRLILAMQMNPNGDGGTLKIAWEKTQYSIPFVVVKK
ncbi:MAG TPA: DUF2911 domain-containing protein [Tepidisphaeraceae bacterium]|nr:DUF2911 domain-containing protein [Tepidisphaeraceae bacterium]